MIDLKKLNKKEVLDLKMKDFTTLSDFLQTGKATHSYDGCPVSIEGDDYLMAYVAAEHAIVSLGVFGYGGENENRKTIGFNNASKRIKNPLNDDEEAITAFVLPSNKKNQKHFLLVNGDGDNWGSEQVSTEGEKISVSFACIGRLLEKKRVKTPKTDPVITALVAGDIKILDYTSDHTIELTKAQKTKVKGLVLASAAKKLTAPPGGYTLMTEGGDLPKGKKHWHRSATVLFTKDKTSYIVGQDEETYFGCELTDNPKTIEAAFLSLSPPIARKKKDVLRQGEWFAVPFPAKTVPPATASIIEPYGEFVLPKDDPDSNEHIVNVSDDNCRITAEGIFVRTAYITHEEHEVLNIGKAWHILVKSTAVRSVSEAGVD